VKYSLQAWAPYRDGSFIYYLNSIDIVDDHTLTIEFSEGYGNLLIEMSGIYVSLPGALDDQGNVVNWIGTGPFVLADYKVDQSALLKTSKAYWNKERIPAVDEVKWVVIPDENARVMALQSGIVDALGVSEHYCELSFATIAEIMDKDEFAVEVEQDLGLVTIYAYNYRQGPMTDIHLRRAVTFAIDRQTISSRILYGIGKASGDFLTRAVNYSPSKEIAYGYDVEAAKSALAAGGYLDSDGDGIVEKNGQPIKLKLLIKSNETPRAVAVFVADCLRKVGIDTEVDALENMAFSERASKGAFDICQTHPWVTTPQTYMSWRGATSEYDDFGIGFGVSPTFKTYLDSILLSTGKEKLQTIFDKIWHELYEFCPGTGLYIEPRVFVHKKNISNFIFNPDTEVIDLSDVAIN
jgi:ABC-type transport system substrate-binding protein